MRHFVLVVTVLLFFSRVAFTQTASGVLGVQVNSQAVPGASDNRSGGGTFTLGTSVATSVASASGSISSNGGTLAAHGHAHAVGGLQYTGWDATATVQIVLERQVCIVPTDPTLLGHPVNVSFGAVGATTSVQASFSVNTYGYCGSSSALALCIYEINGASAGGFQRQLTKSDPLCYPDVDTLSALPSTGVAIVLGTPFTVRLTGSVMAGVGNGQVYGPFGTFPAYQSSGEATATADFSLGYPLVQDAGGAPVQYTWMDCTSVQGIPLVPTSTLPPDVGIPSCFGDGAQGSTTCPCANHSTTGSGTGCLNAVATGGRLRAQGHASLASDDVVLLASGMPSTVCLFFQGTDGLTGIAFGDGLFCVGGTITRLSVQIASTGDASIPGPGDSPLSIQGSLPPGVPSSRSYQVWYRDADPSFCTTATFNLSNALRIDWTP